MIPFPLRSRFREWEKVTSSAGSRSFERDFAERGYVADDPGYVREPDPGDFPPVDGIGSLRSRRTFPK